jgi:site-specific DNA recombinase
MPPRKQHPAKGWAGAFDRTSLVRTDLQQDSPENQQRLNRQAALAYGLKIHPSYIFSERGVTASKPIPREAIQRGINAVVHKKAIEALIFPSVDRCSRLGMRHIGEMLDAVEAVGGRIIFVRNNLDSSLPANRAIIAFQAEQARDEAATLSWRIGTWREGCRIKGKWTGKRPYGYLVVDGKLVPHPDEAPIVRRIVVEFLEGTGLGSIAVALNKEGVPSPAASKAREILAEGRETKSRVDMPWSRQTLTRILHNPALVGWQRHNGRIVLGPDGEPVSFGKGILPLGEHARVLAELNRRTEIVRHNQTGKRKLGTKTGSGRLATNLLIGFACCGGCNYNMETLSAYQRIAGRYRCGTWSRSSPCPGRAEIRIDHADEEVMRQLRLRLGAMEPNDPILDAIAERWRELTMPEDEGERAVLQSRLGAVRARIVDLEEARYIRGDFTAADDIARWDRMMDRLKVQRDAVLQNLEELGPPPDFDPASLRAAYASQTWDATPMPQRRRLLQIAVAKVIVKRAERRGVPASDRVRVVLVGEEPEASNREHGIGG